MGPSGWRFADPATPGRWSTTTTCPAAARRSTGSPARAERPRPDAPCRTRRGSRGANEFSVVEEVPQIQNGGEVRRLIERNYPRLLRDAGVNGRVVVRVLVLESGEVASDSVLVYESTLEAFNEAAMKVARGMRFTPARLEGGRAVRVWVLLPITFSVGVANP
jgi:TonB family protein